MELIPNKHKTFIQRRPKIFDIFSTLYECYVNVLRLLSKTGESLLFSSNVSMTAGHTIRKAKCQQADYLNDPFHFGVIHSINTILSDIGNRKNCSIMLFF